MNSFKLCLTTCAVSWIAVSLSSCSLTAPSSDRNPPPTLISPTAIPTQPSPQIASPTPTPTNSPSPTTTAKTQLAAPEKIVLVDIYEVDSQCLKLIPEKTAVPANRSLDATISKILADQQSVDFTVSGYRVTVNDGVAVIDMRAATDSKRRFSSLSTCEQLALFGSIRKTLLSHSGWKIQSVQFTEKGKEILF